MLENYIHRVFDTLWLPSLFPAKPIVYFKTNASICNCNGSARVIKTHTRTIVTLEIGEFEAHITQMCCSICQQHYENSELKEIVPHQAKFGFDVIAYVGTALYVQHRNDLEVQQALRERNVSISLSEISFLGRKFIIYLALAHRESREELKHLMQTKGGYILHLDGTCEGDSAHLMTSIDEISNIVLDNLKIPTENADLIIPMLERIKKNYGDPIALVHDMGGAILKAVEKVFPDIKDYICHYHFLRDIGKDLFGTQYNNLRRYLQNHGIKSKLRKTVRGLKKLIEQESTLLNSLSEYLDNENLSKPSNEPLPLVAAYVLIAWVLESSSGAYGFGFPFDRVHLDFYLRLKEVYPELKRLRDKMPKGSPSLNVSAIYRALNDSGIKQSVFIMQEKIEVFDDLRECMRIALPDRQQGLNDNGDDDITTIEARVKAFRHSEKLRKLAKKDISYRKMVKQIDKYWEKLFADPIHTKTDVGDIIIQPQRTNNLMETFFRSVKSDGRKKSGTKSLRKKINAMLADTPLIKNLDNSEYMKIILNGKQNLEERFAQIDIKEVREELKAQAEVLRKYPKGMAKVFKLRKLPKWLAKKVAKMAA